MTMMNEGLNIEELSKSCHAVNPGDYLKNDLVYCAKCHTPKQCTLDFIDGKRTVFCLCECDKRARDQKSGKKRESERRDYTSALISQGINDNGIKAWTFEKDDGLNKNNMEIAKIYVENFSSEFYLNNTGMVFWGDVGTGKTFMAACIANGLLSHNIPVLMTNFSKIINELFSTQDKNKYLEAFNHYKLLIIDDLGVERKSDYALEQVYAVIDQRYKDKQPLIITTNLTVKEMENPQNIAYSRIYDRILEMCVPVAFLGENKRKAKKSEQMTWAKERFKR